MRDSGDDSDSQGGSDDDDDEEDEAQEFNLMARNFRKFLKPKENKAFVGGAWSDSKDDNDPQKDATCLMAIDSQENSSVVLDDMLSRGQKLSQDKKGLRFSINEKTASVSLSKPIAFLNEGKNGILKKSSPDVPCDALTRHQRARSPIKSGIRLMMLLNLLGLKLVLQTLESGCTKYMPRNRKLFTSYKAYDGGHVISESNLKGKVIVGAVTLGGELLVFRDGLRVMCRLMGDLDLVTCEWAYFGLVIMILGTSVLTGLTAVTNTGLDLVSTAAGTICF
uniref:Uncharacterized protein n=1 Tax=Tanacetum cinerariifolium TaxID=118510 RepID=A0A699H206_TANCI|nr:hypothetical protein [Tanacetum cinerariifolium]